MNDLKSKYRKATIPKGTLLFRRAHSTEIFRSMFFSFDTIGTSSIEQFDLPIQIWETSNDIVTSLIVKDDESNGRILQTDIEFCYFKFCGKNLHYLDIKNFQNPNRELFLNFLISSGINSWISSVENNISNELHLFTSENKKLVKFKSFLTSDLDYFKCNTFKKVIIQK